MVGALALARYVFNEIGHGRRPEALVHGLFAWDGWHYRELAELGYHGSPLGNARFFPLYPLLGRGVGAVFLGHDDIGLLIVANASALVFGGLLHRVVMRETNDPALARRSVWLGALLPQMYMLVLGYSEATLMALSAGVFLCLRAKRWWWAAALGALAALTRPPGVLLALPALIEGVRAWNGSRNRDRVASAAAVLGPVLGLAGFLAWSQHVYGDWFEPFRIQEVNGLRGGFVDPVSSLAESFRQLMHGDHLGAGAHVLWAPIVFLFVVAAARRLPASYTVYAIAVVLVALSSENISSFERYAMSAFPVIVGAAVITERPRDLWPAALAVSTAGLLGLSMLVYLGRFVP
ncbi:MAG: hypothetical protein ACXVIM_03145 [Acidimicrobiia bacterium]